MYNAFVANKELDTEEFSLLTTEKQLKRVIEAADLIKVRTNLRKASNADGAHVNDNKEYQE